MKGKGFNVPEDVQLGPTWRWIHPQPKSCLILGIISSEVAWYVGHFYGGRMRRCKGEGCELCQIEIGRQVRYLLHVAELATKQQGIWEFGPGSAEKIQTYTEELGFLKGIILEVARTGKHKNSKIDVKLVRQKIQPWLLAIKPIDLDIVLEKTFERMEHD